MRISDWSSDVCSSDLLGATHAQVFWKVLIPFLRPAIFSAMGLAFLTSFENYNTTVFTIQAKSTLTTVLAGKVRMGTQPDLAALAVLIIGVTLVRSEEHTSELQSLMRISYAVFCL